MLHCIGVHGRHSINDLYPFSNGRKFYILDTDDLRVELVSSNTIKEALTNGIHIDGCKISNLVEEEGKYVSRLFVFCKDVYDIFGERHFYVDAGDLLVYFSTAADSIELGRLDIWHEGYYYQFTRQTVERYCSLLLVNGVKVYEEATSLVILRHLGIYEGVLSLSIRHRNIEVSCGDVRLGSNLLSNVGVKMDLDYFKRKLFKEVIKC